MNILNIILRKKKYTRLSNGQRVKMGDVICFINSDGIKCTDEIRERGDGSLYFWNITAHVSDYKSATIVNTKSK